MCKKEHAVVFWTQLVSEPTPDIRQLKFTKRENRKRIFRGAEGMIRAP